MVGQCLARHRVMASVHRTSAVGSQPIEIRFARHVGRAQPVDDDVNDVLDLVCHGSSLRLCEGYRDASQQGNQDHGGSARGRTITLPSFGPRYSSRHYDMLKQLREIVVMQATEISRQQSWEALLRSTKFALRRREN